MRSIFSCIHTNLILCKSHNPVYELYIHIDHAIGSSGGHSSRIL
jgi:hypothetical protein